MLLARRQFLQTSTVGLVALTLRRPAGAAAARSDLILGFSLYGMKTLPLAQALAECARIGYKAVEFALMPGFPTDLKTLSAPDRRAIPGQLAALRLKVSSLLVNFSLVADPAAHAANLEAIKAAAEFAHELNPASPPILETVMGGKPDGWEASKAGMVTQLRAWGAAATKAGAVIAVKGHVSAAVNSPDRLLWIVEQAQSPAIVVAYDHSHFELGGITIEESLRALGAKARFVHVKDAVMEGKAVRFLLPGEGRTDYVNYFQRLRASGYRGDVVVEVSSQIFNRPGYDPIKAAEQSYQTLAPALAQAS